MKADKKVYYIGGFNMEGEPPKVIHKGGLEQVIFNSPVQAGSYDGTIVRIEGNNIVTPNSKQKATHRFHLKGIKVILNPL